MWSADEDLLRRQKVPFENCQFMLTLRRGFGRNLIVSNECRTVYRLIIKIGGTGMSRIGRMPIAVPAGVTVDIAENNKVTVKGPKGTLERVLPSEKQSLFPGRMT